MIGIEAAHIKFKTDGGPDVVPNGLALCALHHKMFDRGAIGLTDKLRIQVSQDLTGHSVVKEMALRFNKQMLTGPQSSEQLPKIDFVKWHEKNAFRRPARV